MWEAIAKNSKLYFLTALWLSVCWAYSGAFPRPFDDAKDLIFYVGAGLFTLWSIAEKKETHFRINPIFFCVGLYFLFGIASAAFAHAKYESIISLGKLWICVGFAWSLSVIDGVTLLRLIKISVWNAAVIAFLNILQINNFNIFTEFSGFIFPVGHISYYSLFMATHIPLTGIAVAYYLNGKDRWWAAAYVQLAILITLGQILSATRAGFVGIVAGLIVFVIGGGIALRVVTPKVIAWTLAAIGGILAYIYFFQPVGLPFRGPILSRLISLSPSGRIEGYIHTLRMIADRPLLGWGPGNFRFVYPEYGHTPGISNTWFYHPHNEILHQLSEAGGLGIVALVGLIVAAAYYAIRELRRANPVCGINLLLVVCGMVIAFVSFQFETSFLLPVSRMICCLYGAIFLKLIGDRMPHFRLNITPLVMVTTLIIFMFVSFYQVSLWAVMKSRTAKTPEASISWANRGVMLAPGSFEALYQYNAVTMAHGNFNFGSLQILHAQFPYVPAALYMSAVGKIYQDHISEARSLVEHALANDHAYSQARDLLKALDEKNENKND